jgi:hypothetical protein
MVWLTAFQDVLRAAAGPSAGGDPIGDTDALVAIWPGGVRIDDPGAGRIEGIDSIRAYLADEDAWLGERAARPERVALTANAVRTIGEFDVHLTQAGERFILPVAIAIEPSADRRSCWIRIYHSHWPILGHHIVRPPLLERDPSVRESDIVGEYQAALAAGDAERITATFEPDGCFREPAGPQYRVCGTGALLPFFAGFFAVGGGIILEHCTVTEDGVRTALEFNAIRWGEHDMPHQAGIAVYERGTSGRLASARIYDDVSPPLD